MLGTLLSFVLVYIFRIKWTRFPTSVFLISFPLDLLTIYLFNSFILKRIDGIRKYIAILGNDEKESLIYTSKYISKIYINDIKELITCSDIDEIIICKNIFDEKNYGLLIYLLQRLKTNIFFTPNLYSRMLTENLNGDSESFYLATFLGKNSDTEEFIIKLGDMVRFDGYLTDFEQRIDSMQVDGQPIGEAKKGMEIAMKVVERVRPGDEMWGVEE